MRFSSRLGKRDVPNIENLKDVCDIVYEDGIVCKITVKKINTSLSRFLSRHKTELSMLLAKYGALLFRGFRADGNQILEFVSCCFGNGTVDLQEETSPRSKMSRGIYTSTEYAKTENIEFHNECSYQTEVPQYLYMYCEKPAARGGKTLLSNCENISLNMDREIAERFDTHGYIYERRYLPNTGISWQESFKVGSIKDLALVCESNAIELRIVKNSSLKEDIVTTRQKRPCFATHPSTGKKLWLNHCLFFNRFSLPEEYAQQMDFDDELMIPYDTFYGDQSVIEPYTLEYVKRQYYENSVAIEWQRGDVLVFDNLMRAHAREPFFGKRELYLAMSDLVTWKDLCE